MDHLSIEFDVLNGYSLKNVEPQTHLSGAFIDKMAAQIQLKGEHIGIMGVVHPNVLKNYELKVPCIALELNVSKIVDIMNLL